jgi:TolA-binding protein
MFKRYLLILSIFLGVLHGEISVFGAGDLNSDNPYGLTDSEREIVENRNSIEKLEKIDRRMDNRIDNLSGTVKALQDLIQSMGKQGSEHKQKIDKLMDDLRENNLITEIKYKEISRNINSTQNRVKQQEVETKKSLNEKIKESFAHVNSVLEKQEKRLGEIEKGIETDYKNIQTKLNSIKNNILKIEKKYKDFVTKKQLDFVVEDINAFKETVISEFEKLSKFRENYYDFTQHSNYEIFSEAKKMFSLGKYKETIKFFEYLVTKHYRPATDNFYIGESYYFLGEYEQAVKHYKESVTIYDKSDFMPTLLLHSALSLERIGDLAQATTFYTVLKAQYGTTPEGQKAIEFLNKTEGTK